ncbi:MAG: hypothetical protein JW708_03485 [Vallitaleaceae bacterium]|nr:hypothetical protein [Vallitaleaceae bacterium]
MPEFITRISNQLTEFWNKFNVKQKIQIIATIVIAIAAMVILVLILNQPKFVLLQGDLQTKDISGIVEALTSSGIESRIGDDAKSIYVEASQKKNATIALADVGIITNEDMTATELFNNGIMTSNAEKALKAQEFAEAEIARKLEMIEAIEEAGVELQIPSSTTSILDETIKARASIILTAKEDLSSEIVNSVARFVATAVANLDLANITVIDSIGRLLYDGETQSGGLEGIGNAQEYEIQKELVVKNNVRSILLSAGEFDDAMVAVDLVIDYDQLEKVTETHTTQDGTNTGIISQDSTYLEESVNSSTSGAPGTDSNGVTDTLIGDSGESTVNIEERNVVYTYDTEVATAVKAIGGVLYDQSTVTVSLSKYKTYDQAILEGQVDSPLGDLSWDEFKYQIESAGRIKIEEIDQDIIDIVMMASNIENVKVVAYEVPRFIDKVEEEAPITDYVLIGIIVLMLLLLGFAVYKGTTPVEIKEIEPELSVEDMLTTTKEKQELESIEFDGKSEARQMIEDFVDHNPDAVALLLRNWLNEDWE